MPKEDFNFFVPFSEVKKSETKVAGKPVVTVAGWASTADRDFQGEVVDPVGVDVSYFVPQGWINFEHNSDEVIGFPTDNTYVDPNKGLYVEAKLFANNEHVKSLVALAENLEVSGSDRKLGFSIEGQIGERDEDNPSIIRSVLITAVAATIAPANPEARWAVVQKSIQDHNIQVTKKDVDTQSMTMGYGIAPEDKTTGGALGVEALLGAVRHLAHATSTPDGIKVLKHVADLLDAQTDTSQSEQLVLLQLITGVSRQEAMHALDNMGLTNTPEN